MGEEIRIEHALAWRDRLLLERLVRGVEKWLLATAPPAVREELSREIAAMVTEAEAVAKQTQAPHQGA